MISWLKENGTSLFLSVVLSLAIWVVAVRQDNPIEQREFSGLVDVEVQGKADELVIAGDYTRAVQVSLRAPRSTWEAIDGNDVSVIADLSGLGEGTYAVPLQVSLPPQLQALNAQADPPEITISLEEQRARDLPVHVVIEGEPALGFGVGAAGVTPESVVVSGPVSLVDRVSEVSVGLNVEGRREAVQRVLPVSVLDAEGNAVEGLQVRPTEVQVSVPVTPRPDFKEVSLTVRLEGAPAPGYYVSSVDVTPQTVTVQGQPQLIDQTPGFIETTPVDLSGLRESVTSSVGLDLPEGLVAVEQTPVEVRVTIEGSQGSRTLQRSFEIVGLESNLVAVASPDTIDLILSGPVSQLNQLTENDVVVHLDLADFTPGTYQVEPVVTIVPEGIITESVLPSIVEVQIRRANTPSS